MERYEIIQKIKRPRSLKDCPIIIVSSALTLDKQLDAVLLQLKYQNLSQRVITAVYISVICLGVSGEQLVNVDGYTYLDLQAGTRQMFGADSAVYLPDKRTRNIKVRCDKILFADGMIWENMNGQFFEYVPEPVYLQDIMKPELFTELIEELNAENIRVQELLYPAQIGNIQVCACGNYRLSEEQVCWGCGKETAWWAQHISQEYLQAQIEEKRKQELSRLEELEQQKPAQNRKHRKTAIALGVISALLIVCFTVVWYFTGSKDRLMSKTKDNLQPYIDIIGEETDDGSLNVSPEIIGNMVKVQIMGIEGTVEHSMTERSGDTIAVLSWKSNGTADQKEFDKLAEFLTDYFDSEPGERSYENITDEPCLVWEDTVNDCWVIGWLEDEHINLWWYDKEWI